MIKIRLQRGGRRKKPVYAIVAAESSSPRDGRFLQKLGQYDPAKEENPLIDLKTEDIKTWVGKGAQFTDTVNSLFKKHKVQL